MGRLLGAMDDVVFVDGQDLAVLHQPASIDHNRLNVGRLAVVDEARYDAQRGHQVGAHHVYHEQVRFLAYLQAAELAVAEMGKDGRVVLVAEAVLAGAAEDVTPELEARIAARLEAEAQP